LPGISRSHPDTDLRDGLRGQETQLSLGPHDLARIDSQAQRVRRTDADIARSPKSGFYANLQERGIGLTTQGGRTAVTDSGDITLIDAGRPFAFEFNGDSSSRRTRCPCRAVSRGELPQSAGVNCWPTGHLRGRPAIGKV